MVSYLLNGATPNIFDMKFIFTSLQPVVVDIGKRNSSHELKTFSKRAWKKYIMKTKIASLTKFMAHLYPDCFRPRRDKKYKCILYENVHLDDWTHLLLCENANWTFQTVLEKHVPDSFPLKKYCEDIVKKLNQV